MRSLKNISIMELLVNKPSLDEAVNYIYTWYKERENDYGDFYKRTNQIEDIAQFQLENFMKLYHDQNNLTFIEEAEKELKGKMSFFNSFQHSSAIHTVAKIKETEWDNLIKALEKINLKLSQ